MQCNEPSEFVRRKTSQRLLGLLGIKCLYPVQVSALQKGVEDGKNLLIAAPTASGKTLIAMLSIASSLERDKGKAFYTVPLKSIAFEKYKDFRVFEKLGYSVKVSVGDYEKGFPRADIIISTYEKLDSTLRNSPSLLKEMSILVVDEIHFVGDPERGPLLETLLAKILTLSKEVQIVALSATVPNAEAIAKWLSAEPVISNWRPVPLKEGIYDERESKIIFSDNSTKKISKPTSLPYIDLVKDINDEGGYALVFVQSRKKSMQMAKQASKYAKKFNFDEKLAKEYAKEIMSSSAPRFLKEELSSLVLSGISYHHAGLTNDLRMIIEDAFRNGALAAIYATPTLAAGVNLPARRVVVAEYYRYESGYRRPISVSEYKQLAGRAGRPGLDKYGEAIIIVSPTDHPEDVMKYYILGKPEEVKSRLSGIKGVRHSTLGLVASGISELDKILEVHRRTLYSMHGGHNVERLVSLAVEDLIEWELIEENEKKMFRLTPLGKEVSRFYVDPSGVPIVKELLSKSDEVSDIVILYIISRTPDMPKMRVSRREGERLIDEALDEAPEIFDIIEYADSDELSALKISLVMKRWIEEVPEDKIVSNYDIWPGDLHSITETARWLLSAYSNIVEVAPWCKRKEISSRMRILAERVKYGVKSELLPLLAIPGIGRVRARKLYNAGFKTLADLASATPKDLESVPGIGPSTIAAIMEFFGRKGEAQKYRDRDKNLRRGLLAYMDL